MSIPQAVHAQHAPVQGRYRARAPWPNGSKASRRGRLIASRPGIHRPLAQPLSLGDAAGAVGRVAPTDVPNRRADMRFLVVVEDARFKHVYFRGTPNGWETTPMTLADDHLWQTEVRFAEPDDQLNRFEFDINGDWGYNFGDTDQSCRAEPVCDGSATTRGDNGNRSVGDIFVDQPGTYVVTFNDQTLAYRFERIDAISAVGRGRLRLGRLIRGVGGGQAFAAAAALAQVQREQRVVEREYLVVGQLRVAGARVDQRRLAALGVGQPGVDQVEQGVGIRCRPDAGGDGLERGRAGAQAGQVQEAAQGGGASGVALGESVQALRQRREQHRAEPGLDRLGGGDRVAQAPVAVSSSASGARSA